jgi:hypothetical protein
MVASCSNFVLEIFVYSPLRVISSSILYPKLKDTHAEYPISARTFRARTKE